MVESTKVIAQLLERNLEVAVVMSEIAHETMNGGFSTKTIAIGTMVYLPGASVSMSAVSNKPPLSPD